MYVYVYVYVYVCICFVCVYVKEYTLLVKIDIWERALDRASLSHTSSSPIEQSLVKWYY
jgi:hypothetical protein